MNLKGLLVGGFAALGLALASGATASAQVFDWSASGLYGYTVSGNGTITATPLGGGAYAVTAMTGAWDSSTITSLASYAGDDERVYATSPNLDYPGLAFELADGNVFNFYYDTSTTDSYACRAVGYCEVGPGVPGTSGLGGPGVPADATNPISFTLTAVPEPATWALMLVGFFGLGAMIRSRKIAQFA